MNAAGALKIALVGRRFGPPRVAVARLRTIAWMRENGVQWSREQLVHLCCQMATDTASVMIMRGWKSNWEVEHTASVLASALQKGNAELVGKFDLRGVNMADSSASRLLRAAIYGGHIPAAEAVRQLGVQVTASHIQVAAAGGSVEMVDWTARASGVPNVRQPSALWTLNTLTPYKNAILIAARLNRVRVVRHLLPAHSTSLFELLRAAGLSGNYDLTDEIIAWYGITAAH